MTNNTRYKMPNYKLKYFNTSLLMMGDVLSAKVSNLDLPTKKALIDYPKYSYFPMSVEFNKIFDFIESYSDLYKNTLLKSLNGEDWTEEETLAIFNDLLPKFIKYGVELFEDFRFKDFAKMVLTTHSTDIRHFTRLLKGLMRNFYYHDSFLPSFNLINKMSQFIWFFQLLQEFESNDFSSYSNILVKEMKYVGALFVEFEKQMSFVSSVDIHELVYVDSQKNIALINNFLLKISNYLLGFENGDDYKNNVFMLELDFWREPSFFYEGILDSKDLKGDIANIPSILKQNNKTVFLSYYRELQMIRTLVLSYLKRFDPKEPLYIDDVDKQIDFDEKFSKVLDILNESCFYFDEYNFVEASTKEVPLYKIDSREAVIDYNGFSMVFKSKLPKSILYKLQKAIDLFWHYSDSYGFDRSLFANMNKIICASKKYAFKFKPDEDLGGVYFHGSKNILIYLETFDDSFYPIYENWNRNSYFVQPENYQIDKNGVEWVYIPIFQSYYAVNVHILKFFECTLIHEIGHYFYFVVMNEHERSVWCSTGWHFDAVNQKYIRSLHDSEYASSYANSKPEEDFAETFFVVLSSGSPTNQGLAVAFQRFNDVINIVNQRINIMARNNPNEHSMFDGVNSYLNKYLNTSTVKIEQIVDFRDWDDDLTTGEVVLDRGDFYFEGFPNELVFDYRPTFFTFINPKFKKRTDESQKEKDLLELSVKLLVLSYIKLYGIEAFEKLISVYGYAKNIELDTQIEDMSKQITKEMLSHKYIESNQKMFMNICRTLFDVFAEIMFI